MLLTVDSSEPVVVLGSGHPTMGRSTHPDVGRDNSVVAYSGSKNTSSLLEDDHSRKLLSRTHSSPHKSSSPEWSFFPRESLVLARGMSNRHMV